MKPIVTIRSAQAAWSILKKANLHHFLDSGALYALQRLTELKINLSDIISDLLEGGVLVEFLSAITESSVYLDDSGNKVPWDSVPMPVIGGLISDFFSAFTSSFKLPKSS